MSHEKNLWQILIVINCCKYESDISYKRLRENYVNSLFKTAKIIK